MRLQEVTKGYPIRDSVSNGAGKRLHKSMDDKAFTVTSCNIL